MRSLVAGAVVFCGAACVPVHGQEASTTYAHASPVDIDLDGPTMIGKKVLVHGFMSARNVNEAKIYNKKSDTHGILVDLDGGSKEVRRHLLENCAFLSANCEMEIKATVVGDPQGAHLRLD